MQSEPSAHIEIKAPDNNGWQKFRIAMLLVGALLVFLFAINLMVASLHRLGTGLSESILLATANPFTGLFIGLLVTALLQSSSTSTSLVVAFVASGSITVDAAIPLIMGANIGTTITSTIVSLGFINRKKEFKRAVAAGTYHDFFNILTVLILFPLQYYYRVLSNLATRLADLVFVPVLNPGRNVSNNASPWFDPVISLLSRLIPSGLVLSILSIALLFGSILLFRRMVSNLLNVKQPQKFRRFFFKSGWKSFSWGVVTTAAIRSSTITTSVVVPVVAKKIVTLRQAAPFILGANIGTTITAFIAVSLNPTTREAIIIASTHLLFNLVGVLVFFIVPFMRSIPLGIATWLGRMTLKYRLTGFVYLLSTFFFIPFVLIYLNQDTVSNYSLLYQRLEGNRPDQYYQLNVRLNSRTLQGEWTAYPGRQKESNRMPLSILPVSVKNKTLFVGQEMFLFNRPGFCWDGEKNGKLITTCVSEILPKFAVSDMTFDSVYVFRQTPKSAGDSIVSWYYYSAHHKIYLLHEVDSGAGRMELERLVAFEKK